MIPLIAAAKTELCVDEKYPGQLFLNKRTVGGLRYVGRTVSLGDVRGAVSLKARVPGKYNYGYYALGILSIKNQKFFRLTSHKDNKQVPYILKTINDWLQQHCTLEPAEIVWEDEQKFFHKKRKKKSE